jgi:hypothetical protein
MMIDDLRWPHSAVDRLAIIPFLKIFFIVYYERLSSCVTFYVFEMIIIFPGHR